MPVFYNSTVIFLENTGHKLQRFLLLKLCYIMTLFMETIEASYENCRYYEKWMSWAPHLKFQGDNNKAQDPSKYRGRSYIEGRTLISSMPRSPPKPCIDPHLCCDRNDQIWGQLQRHFSCQFSPWAATLPLYLPKPIYWPHQNDQVVENQAAGEKERN